MIAQEAQLWRLLKKNLAPYKQLILHRIESTTGSGVPDVTFTDGTINGWIELKVKTVNVGNVCTFKSLGLSSAQIVWLAQHPVSFVLAKVNGALILLDSYAIRLIESMHLDFSQVIACFQDAVKSELSVWSFIAHTISGRISVQRFEDVPRFLEYRALHRE